jgi:hypothetical protein
MMINHPEEYTQLLPFDLLDHVSVKFLRKFRKLTDEMYNCLPDNCYTPLPSIGQLIYEGIDIHICKCNIGQSIYMCLCFKTVEDMVSFSSILYKLF